MANYNRSSGEIKRSIYNFSNRITSGIKKTQKTFIFQMLYGLSEGNLCHLSEIARRLKEKITLKKTIERLSRNLQQFDDQANIWANYMDSVKEHTKEASILLIDNSEFVKPCSEHMQGLCKVRDGSTGEIARGYHTIDAAVLSKDGKMPLPVYSRVFSSEEKEFISQTDENLRCLSYLSQHFNPTCIRTLDRGFDANAYFQYFLDPKRKEKFIIRLKKTRMVIHQGESVNVLDVANQYKGKYAITFRDKKNRKIDCKMAYIPVRCAFAPNTNLTLIVVYGFGKVPMLLLSNLLYEDLKNLAMTITKVYLLRWRIEEYFKFKKNQFQLEDFRVMSLASIRNFNLIATLLTGYIGFLSESRWDSIFVQELLVCSKRIFSIPNFCFYALGYAISDILKKTTVGIQSFLRRKPSSQQLDLFSLPAFRSQQLLLS